QANLAVRRRRLDRVEALGCTEVGGDGHRGAGQPLGDLGEESRPASDEHDAHAPAGELGGERCAESLGRARDERPRPVAAGEPAAGHAAGAVFGSAAASAAAGRWNGWSRRMRHIMANGISSHGAFTARTNGRFAAGVTPYASSMRMIRTFAIMVPDHTRAGSRIQSRPRMNA